MNKIRRNKVPGVTFIQYSSRLAMSQKRNPKYRCPNPKCRHGLYSTSIAICPKCNFPKPYEGFFKSDKKKRQELLDIPPKNAHIWVPKQLRGTTYKHVLKINGENICRMRPAAEQQSTANITVANAIMIHQLSQKMDNLQDQNTRVEKLLTEFLDRLEFVPGGTEYDAARQDFEKTTSK